MMNCILTITLLVTLAADPGQADDASVTARFIEQIRTWPGYDASARDFVVERWTQRGEDFDERAFLLEALAVCSEPFRAGLDAFDEDRHAQCAEIMARLKDDPEPFLATNAAVFEAKALVANDDLELAEQRLNELLHPPDRLIAHSYAQAEMHYLLGFSQLGNLKYEQAQATLAAFLEMHPGAPQRLRLTAQQMLAEIRQFTPGQIGEVTDLMDYSARRLASTDSGTLTRDRQQKIIDILDKLIEDAQQREKSSGGGGSGSSQSKSQQKPGQANKPMNQSTLPKGSADPGTKLRQRVALPGEAWGGMKPADRQRIIQQLKDRFPARYRQLVEQYYRQLAEEP
ncbi:MAG: tol-pal system YbgF family protein [Phycisphaerae bacterium]